MNLSPENVWLIGGGVLGLALALSNDHGGRSPLS